MPQGFIDVEKFWFTNGDLCVRVTPMAELTPEILRQIMPTLPKGKREEYAPMLDTSMEEFDINTERRVAAYLANLSHESNNLTRWEENLNYSAKRLTQVWPRRFPTVAIATPYAHNPEALANKTYGGRMGNNKPGDGWKYRGRGPLQITGKSLYLKASEALNEPRIYDDPDIVLKDPMIAFRVSAWIFAREKGGNQLADRLQLKALTKAINGGYNGLAERIELFNRALRVLPDDFKLTSSARPVREDTEAPDYFDGAEIEEIVDEDTEDKGLSTSPNSIEGETEGVPPPTPAVQIEASKPSFASKITALSMPAGAATIVTGLFTFIKGIPPWGWAVIGGCFVVLTIVGAWIYNESMKRAADRTRLASSAAADKDKNNIRYI